MTRTRQEVRNFLEGQVGHTCVDKSNANLNGQCVCLIKCLMEFLGVPNPYAARGNAKDAGNAYIAQGIGTSGKGWLTICVNPSMGGGYGHIWIDLADEANYESNGAVALRVTKNTRPITQARQFVNFDKWIKEEGGSMAEKLSLGEARILAEGILGRDRDATHAGKNDADLLANHAGRDLTNAYIHWLWVSDEANAAARDRAAKNEFWAKYKAIIGDLESRPTKDQLAAVQAQLADEAKKVAEAEQKLKEAQEKQSEDTQLLDNAGSWLTKLFNRLFKKG